MEHPLVGNRVAAKMMVLRMRVQKCLPIVIMQSKPNKTTILKKEKETGIPTKTGLYSGFPLQTSLCGLVKRDKHF